LIVTQGKELEVLQADLSMINETQFALEVNATEHSKQVQDNLLKAVKAKQRASTLAAQIDKTADSLEEALSILGKKN
jgi:hypothetical protein